MGKIVIFLDKITNLCDQDVLGKSDPYVKFHLEQDNLVFDKNYGRKTSTKKRGELNPVFGETFEFDDVPSLKNLVLNVKVMDDDPGFDDKLGSCKIDLEELGLGPNPTGTDRKIPINDILYRALKKQKSRYFVSQSVSHTLNTPKKRQQGRVVKLADTTASKAVGLTSVGVQVPPRPFFLLYS